LRRDPPRARVFHKEHHFNAAVCAGLILRDFATSDGYGHVAEDSNLTPSAASAKDWSFVPASPFMRSTKSWALCALTGRAAA